METRLVIHNGTGYSVFANGCWFDFEDLDILVEHFGEEILSEVEALVD